MTNMNKSGYFPVSLPDNYDSGLGFGQGSVDGLYNSYYRGGFHRPQHPHPEFDRDVRNTFNLKNNCYENRCRYDPEPHFDNITNQDDTSQSEVDIPHSVSSSINIQFNNVFFLIIAIILGFFIFSYKI